MYFQQMRFAALLLALGIAGCASLPPSAIDSNCSADYRGIDAQLEVRHAANAGAHRIEGFPYLRSDRFLASFRDEVPDGPRFEAWVERLRRLDLASRAPELRQLGWRNPQEEIAHLDRCGAAWAAQDLADPARHAALRKAAEVPDDYSLLKRTLGLYPLTVPFLRIGMANFNSGVREDYARPADRLDAAGTLTLWLRKGAPAPQARSWFELRDALGIPKLSDAQWQVLAAAHLPNWLIETAGEFDTPGTPAMDGGRRGFDRRPVTYLATGYTRFGGRVLAQLTYVVWFSERPRKGVLDAYGGDLDGIVWRVTLDERGAPLLYDTVHACGCYHYFFSAQPLVRKPEPGLLAEPVMFPQEAPAEPFAIRLASGTHFVRRLVPLADAKAAASNAYALRPYEDLLSLSLFDPNGLIPGTERRERLWLWPAGIKSAGAMRQLGRHPTSFVGRSHFDDPDLLDRLFQE